MCQTARGPYRDSGDKHQEDGTGPLDIVLCRANYGGCPYTLCRYLYSEMRWAATPQIDGKGDSMTAGIVRGTVGVIRILLGEGKDGRV